MERGHLSREYPFVVLNRFQQIEEYVLEIIQYVRRRISERHLQRTAVSPGDQPFDYQLQGRERIEQQHVLPAEPVWKPAAGQSPFR